MLGARKGSDVDEGSAVEFGWSGLKVEALNGLSMREVKHLEKDIALS